MINFLFVFLLLFHFQIDTLYAMTTDEGGEASGSSQVRTSSLLPQETGEGSGSSSSSGPSVPQETDAPPSYHEFFSYISTEAPPLIPSMSLRQRLQGGDQAAYQQMEDQETSPEGKFAWHAMSSLRAWLKGTEITLRLPSSTGTLVNLHFTEPTPTLPLVRLAFFFKQFDLIRLGRRTSGLPFISDDIIDMWGLTILGATLNFKRCLSAKNIRHALKMVEQEDQKFFDDTRFFLALVRATLRYIKGSLGASLSPLQRKRIILPYLNFLHTHAKDAYRSVHIEALESGTHFDLEGNDLSPLEGTNLLCILCSQHSDPRIKERSLKMLVRNPDLVNPVTGKAFSSEDERLRFITPPLLTSQDPDLRLALFHFLKEEKVIFQIKNSKMKLLPSHERQPLLRTLYWEINHPVPLKELADGIRDGSIIHDRSGQKKDRNTLLTKLFYHTHKASEGFTNPKYNHLVASLYIYGVRKKFNSLTQRFVDIEADEAFVLARSLLDPEREDEPDLLLLYQSFNRPDLIPENLDYHKAVCHRLREKEDWDTLYSLLVTGYLLWELEEQVINTRREGAEAALRICELLDPHKKNQNYIGILSYFISSILQSKEGDDLYDERENLTYWYERLRPLLMQEDVPISMRSLRSLLPQDSSAGAVSPPLEESSSESEDEEEEIPSSSTHTLEKEEKEGRPHSRRSKVERHRSRLERYLSQIGRLPITNLCAGQNEPSPLENPRFIWTGKALAHLEHPALANYVALRPGGSPLEHKLRDLLNKRHGAGVDREKLVNTTFEGREVWTIRLSSQHRIAFTFMHEGKIQLLSLLNHYCCFS